MAIKSDGWRDVVKPKVEPFPYGTYMTQAILAGRKTVSYEPLDVDSKWKWICIGNHEPFQNDPDVLKKEDIWSAQFAPSKGSGFYRYDMKWVHLPCREGDFMYVQEECAPVYSDSKHNKVVGYIYKADEGVLTPEDDGCDIFTPKDCQGKWIKSIHMPREAARIFLRVTYLGIYHIQEATVQDMKDCGIGKVVMGKPYPSVKDAFIDCWDSIAGKRDPERWTWKKNPWVLRIDFEQCEKPEIFKV